MKCYIHRSKDDSTGVAEGKSRCQSIHSVLQFDHYCHRDGDGDGNDLVHAVGHGQEDDGSEREVEEQGRPAGCLHLIMIAMIMIVIMIVMMIGMMIVEIS